MTSMSQLKPLTLAVLMLALPPAHLIGAGSAGRRPNIILILTDDQGYGDLGVHGNTTLKTPHLDRFARNGVRIDRFYTSCVCAPTRASLLTGRYFYRTGVIHTSRGAARMHTAEVTLAEHLRAAGYATGVFGKWHLGDNYPMRPSDQGFARSLIHRSGGIGQTPDRPNSYFDSILWQDNRRIRARGYCTDVFFEAAGKFIDHHRESPFFVYLSLNAPHTPLEIGDDYTKPYRDLGVNDTTVRIYGMVANLDENVGRLLAKLQRWGLRENTIVVFASDNGPQQDRFNAGLRGRKGSVYEGGIRTFCFWQWPGRFTGARTVQQMTAHIDIAPTLLAAAKVDPRSGSPAMDGQSILPWLLKDHPVEERVRIFQCHRGLTPKRFQNCAVVTQHDKLVVNATRFGDETFTEPPAPQWELYDVRADPGEQTDLAGANSARVRELDSIYRQWFDDVRATRGFQTPRIAIGAKSAPATHLCRYQDSVFQNGEPHGWRVNVLRQGRYRIRLLQGDLGKNARLNVQFQGKKSNHDVTNEQSVTIELPAGEGRLDVWAQAPGTPRQRIRDNSTSGDVVVRWTGSD